MKPKNKIVLSTDYHVSRLEDRTGRMKSQNPIFRFSLLNDPLLFQPCYKIISKFKHATIIDFGTTIRILKSLFYSNLYLL